MSLFEDENYVYCDTFFIYLPPENRPSVDQIQACLETLGKKYESTNLKSTDGKFESVMIRSPHDSSAMDITYVQGDEVVEQVKELMGEFRTMTLSGADRSRLQILEEATARLDVYHFEQKAESVGDEPNLDPGGLMLVMERLSEAFGGVGLDPQSKTLL